MKKNRRKTGNFWFKEEKSKWNYQERNVSCSKKTDEKELKKVVEGEEYVLIWEEEKWKGKNWKRKKNEKNY